MSLIIDNYEIDVETSCTLSYETEVSEFPTEKRDDVTDDLRNKPLALSVSGIVSNTPIGALAERRNTLALVGGEAFALPADEADAKLRSLRGIGRLFVVECSRGRFENMALRSYSPRGSTQDGLEFGADFVQVNLVTNERTTIEVAVPNAGKKQNLGNRASIEAPGPLAPEPSAKTRGMVDDIPESLRP